MIKNHLTSKKSDLHDKIKVGFVSKAHGIKGEIFIRLLNPRPDWPACINTFFIGDVAHSICRFSPHKEGMIVQLKESQSRPSAQALKGLPVFLSKKFFKGKQGERAYLTELISFSVQTHKEIIGRVHSFSFYKGQDFLLIEPAQKSHLKSALKGREGPHTAQSSIAPAEKSHLKDKKLLIPFVKPYIKTVDFFKQKIIMDLPPDFLETFG